MPKIMHKVRIIAGSLRGRRLSFADRPGLRPTGDRIRETLFNWLGRDVEGAACLDLFAGSGALGLEACSRGARKVVLVDNDPVVAGTLEVEVRKLDLATAAVVRARADEYLDGQTEVFDIVFLDPPFGSDLLQPICARLVQNGWVRGGGLAYLETAARSRDPTPPPGMRILKEKTTGRVRYALAEFPHRTPTPK